MSRVCSAPPFGVGVFSFPAAAGRGETGRVLTLLMQPVCGADSNSGVGR